MTVEVLANSACTVAEGPRWNGAERALYWVDTTTGEVLRQHLEQRTADGALLGTIRFPMAKVTSACVGGGCVFVTTGNLPKSDAEYAATKAGGVFALRKESHNNGTV